MPKCNACNIRMNDGLVCRHPKMDGKFVCLSCCNGTRKGKKCGNFVDKTKDCRLAVKLLENHN